MAPDIALGLLFDWAFFGSMEGSFGCGCGQLPDLLSCSGLFGIFLSCLLLNALLYSQINMTMPRVSNQRADPNCLSDTRLYHGAT